MAQPGDNTRGKGKSGGDGAVFKRALTVCMRAIAADKNLEIALGKDKPAFAAGRARLPEPTKKPRRAELTVTRGLGDSMALRQARHDARVHAKLAPEGRQARAIYDAVEQARVEASGANAMIGVGENLSAMLEDKYARSPMATAASREDAPIEEAIAMIVRERLTGRAVPKSANNLFIITVKKTISYFVFINAFLFSVSSIRAQVCNLVCSDLVHASLRADSCKRTFDPTDFLKNPDITCNSYSINLNYPFGTNALDGKSVDASHIGYTFVYKVQNGANSCWGYVTIEDKAIPLPRCKSATISCFQYSKINEIANRIIDNCTQEGKSIITDLKYTDFGCTVPGITGQVIREIVTFDKWGNSGTCHDTLNIRKDSFSLLKGPDILYIPLSVPGYM